MEVFALDALARLAADSGHAADGRGSSWTGRTAGWTAASHFITDHDRTERTGTASDRPLGAR